MKHVMLFSLAFLLLIGCAKDEMLVEPENVNPETADLSVNSTKSFNIIQGKSTPIFYDYFLNGNRAAKGEFSINDQNLWIQLIAKTEQKKGDDRLRYEFHAFEDPQDYFTWAREQGILAEAALSIANTLSQYDDNDAIADYFVGNQSLPEQYLNYVDNLIFNARTAVIGSVEVAPVTTTLFENTINTTPPVQLQRKYTPMMPEGLNKEVSSIQVSGREMFIPTILFEDEFFTNRVNPIIWNLSQQPIVFEGPLEECNNKISSIF